MAKKYSKGASRKVKKVMHERKAGTLKSGRSGRKVKSRKQAIAIGLSEARRAGKRVPKKRAASRSRGRRPPDLACEQRTYGGTGNFGR